MALPYLAQSSRGTALVAGLLMTALMAWPVLAQNAASAEDIPTPVVRGPLANAAFDDPENDYQFFRSDIALESHGYVEEEFFVEGEANAYDIPYPRDEPREPPISLPDRLWPRSNRRAFPTRPG